MSHGSDRPMASGPVIEIRPRTPQGQRPSRALAAVLRKSFVRADPQAGTLVMAEPPALTWRPTREWLLSLPATGRPDAVTTICLASYTRIVNIFSYPQWRMLLLDRDGRALAATRERDQAQGRSLWAAELFTPLQQVGVEVTEEQFASTTELSQAHPSIECDSHERRR
jgi:hypothetical protein